MKVKVKTLVVPIFVLIAYMMVFLINKEVFFEALKMIKGFLLEMIQVLPGVAIISGLIAVWIPKELIIKNFGTQSKLKGKLFSIFLGSVSAGPIYAAFPLCITLKKKGASIGNIIIILSSWAVIKVPMLFMEIKFLGSKFALLRYVMTVPCILLIGYISEKLMKKNTKNEKSAEDAILLPGYNCSACGYASCDDFRAAVINKNISLETCSFTGNKN